MKCSFHRLGPLLISLKGRSADPVCQAVRRELSSLPMADSSAPTDVAFRFVSQLEEPEGLIHVGRWRLADGVVVGRGHGYRFMMRRHTGGFDVQVCPENTERSLTDHYERAWDWNFLAPWETTAKDFMYDLFDLVTGAALLESEAVYLHASSCCRAGNGVALVAWGGVGKTTSVMKLVTEHDWKYLSDDLGMVDADGRLWRTPRKLQVYAYNVDGQNQLKRQLMDGRGPIDRINWHWRRMRFGPKKVRRRISAESMFGADSVAESARLRSVVFLERADTPGFRWSELDAAELARQAATILVDELDTLFEVAVAAESHGVDVGIGSLDRLRTASIDVLNESFNQAATGRLRIPTGAGPDELADALRQHVELFDPGNR